MRVDYANPNLTHIINGLNGVIVFYLNPFMVHLNPLTLCRVRIGLMGRVKNCHPYLEVSREDEGIVLSRRV